MPATILIIDDEEQLRKLVSRIISLEGYQVEQAATIRSGFDVLKRSKIDVVLCDVKLPDGNGVDFVREAKAAFPLLEIILLTAYGNITDGVQAIKNGAFDYIIKGNDNDRIIPLLAQAVAARKGQKEPGGESLRLAGATFADVIGNSPAMRQTLALAKKIATTNTTVLLLGETGTGKEVFAKAFHAEGRRSGQPFIAINCSAFTKELLEGELFGHKAGAFTGALKDKPGLIETAHKGTLFLDEIGEMELNLQAKLLRVLEAGEFIKLGDIKTTTVDVRIIAATNRNLSSDVAAGRFREDLFYRLNTFTLSLPPLRERADDIPELALYFLRRFAAREGKAVQGITAEGMGVLKSLAWRGNIRELRNVIERAVILAEGSAIQPQDLPTPQPAGPAHATSLMEVEQVHIRKILEHTGNNKTRAASLLGIGLATLYRKMEEYGIAK